MGSSARNLLAIAKDPQYSQLPTHSYMRVRMRSGAGSKMMTNDQSTRHQIVVFSKTCSLDDARVAEAHRPRFHFFPQFNNVWVLRKALFKVLQLLTLGALDLQCDLATTIQKL